MTEPTPRPRRRRAAAESEKLAPGLYAVGRYGDRHDLTGRHEVWVGDISTADLYATEGYLRHALALVELERTARQMDQHRQLTRALDLRDMDEPLPKRYRGGAGTADLYQDGLPADVLERVRDGLAENLASDPEVKAVMDASVAELNAVRDEYRSATIRPDEEGEVELSPEVAAKVDEALADPSSFVNRKRPGKRSAEMPAAPGTRPAQPWDNDTDDPWEGIGGSGA